MQMGDMPYSLPDAGGHFGPYGGVFVAETLISALDDLREQYALCRDDPAFIAEFEYELKHYVGRPSPVYHARRWSERLGGAQIHLPKTNHTGAHKINNCTWRWPRIGWQTAHHAALALVSTAARRDRAALR
jgi:tryptophan synthase beta chain